MKLNLSPLEKNAWLGRKASQVNFAIVVRLSGPLPVEQIQFALLEVVKRHPMLSIKLLEEGNNLYLTDQDVPGVPCRVIPNCKENSWREVVQEELRQPFSYNRGPMMRLTLMQCPDSWDLILVCDHGISDGYSTIYFVRDLLSQLSEEEPFPPITSLPPDIWSLIPASVEKSPSIAMKQFMFKLYFQHYIHAASRKNKDTISIPESVENQAQTLDEMPAEQCYRIIHRTLPALQTSALVDRCRRENTSVQAALCVAWGQTMNLLEPDRRSNLRKVSIPVSLRSYLPQAFQQTTGLYISTVNIPIDCSPQQNFWTAARQVKKKLSEATTAKNLWIAPLMMKTMFKAVENTGHVRLINEFVNRQIDYDISITNLGRLDIPEHYGPVKLDAIYGPIVNSYEREKTLGVSTFRGQMQLSFTFSLSQMNETKGEKMMDILVENLDSQYSLAKATKSIRKYLPG